MNLPHPVLNDSYVVFVVECVKENSGIGYDSELSLGLGLEVIAPLKGGNSRIERTYHHNFLSVFQKVDLVEIGDRFLYILRPPEVDLLPLEDNRISIA